MKDNKLLHILHSQVVPAVGCTEPVSVAIAVATAKEHIGGTIMNVTAETSKNIFKNGLRVGIPGTREKGIPFAIALALSIKDPQLDLEIFKNVTEADILRAQQYIDSDIIRVGTTKKDYDFYVDVNLTTSEGTVQCIIESNHTNVVSIKKDGIELISNQKDEEHTQEDAATIESLEEIYDFIEDVSPSDIEFLLEGVEMNLAVSQAGKKEHYSSGLGFTLFRLMESGALSADTLTRIKAYTASACDARMGGLNIPVMSSAGSGNQGISAIIPIAILSKELNCSNESLSRALALSHLITSYIKQQTGRLSPVCGCAVAAGIGAACGMTYLQKGTREEISMAMNNMIGSLSGMVCDGAKGGCSYKLVTAVGEAYQQSVVARSHTTIADYDGIIGGDVEQSITNLASLCTVGMHDVDKTLIDIFSKERSSLS
ncbi:MAG: serine dehydratase subunit alpha family protein [Sphaerochaetaceae bacterium]